MIPQRLKALRQDRKMSMRALAEELNIDASTIAKYETGDREPNSDMLKKLAGYFGVSTDYLLGVVNSPSTIRMKPSNPSIDPQYQETARYALQAAEYKNELGTLNLIDETGGIKHNYLYDFVWTIREFNRDEIQKLAEYAEFVKTQRKK